jgi:Uma2 family endonuclease
MATVVTPVAADENFAELLDLLGNVPLKRIRRFPPPGAATEADVLAALEAPRKRLCELIEGVLVEKVMGFRESVLAMFLVELLNAFIRPRNLGVVAGPDGTIRLFAGRVRIPDIAFVSWDRLPGRRVPTTPIPDLAPDLAAEILSPSNTSAEMALKRRDYFAARVRLVWEIDPDSRTVKVFTGPDAVVILTVTDPLDGGDVLPGFTLPLRDLFAELDRQG